MGGQWAGVPGEIGNGRSRADKNRPGNAVPFLRLSFPGAVSVAANSWAPARARHPANHPPGGRYIKFGRALHSKKKSTSSPALVSAARCPSPPPPPSTSAAAFRAPARDRGRAGDGMAPGWRRQGLAAAAIALMQVSPHSHAHDSRRGVLYRVVRVVGPAPWRRRPLRRVEGFWDGFSVMLWGLDPA